MTQPTTGKYLYLIFQLYSYRIQLSYIIVSKICQSFQQNFYLQFFIYSFISLNGDIYHSSGISPICLWQTYTQCVGRLLSRSCYDYVRVSLFVFNNLLLNFQCTEEKKNSFPLYKTALYMTKSGTTFWIFLFSHLFPHKSWKI